MAQKTPDPLTLCAHRYGCYRSAVVPPEGYVQNYPVCLAHITRCDSLLYDEELHKSWGTEEGKQDSCAFCDFPLLGARRDHVSRMPCCRVYVCCGPYVCDGLPTQATACPACGASLSISEEEQRHPSLDAHLRTKVSPVRWFAPWVYVEEIARDSDFVKHPSQLDLYKVTYLKMVEKGLDIADTIARAKANFAQNEGHFRDVLSQNEEKFNDLFSFYKDLLVQLGVNPTVLPAFVPPVALAAFRPLSSEAR